MRTIVISLGGSVLLSDELNKGYYKEFKNLLRSQKNTKFFVVVGGGPPARKYISQARLLGISEKLLDSIGIAVTRVNALFLACQLQENIYTIPHSIEEAVQSNQHIVVMGGTTPGHSTDFVGAELSNLVNAGLFVIATNVDGVYDADPNINHDATRYSSVSAHELLKTYGSQWKSAGGNIVIDGPALQKIYEKHIQTVVIDGRDIDNFQKVLNNQSFHGTTITV